jgi:hypothetical protein
MRKAVKWHLVLGYQNQGLLCLGLRYGSFLGLWLAWIKLFPAQGDIELVCHVHALFNFLSDFVNFFVCELYGLIVLVIGAKVVKVFEVVQ